MGPQAVGRGLPTLATMPASCMKSRLSRVVFLAMECVLRRAKRSRSVRCSALLYLVAASGEGTRGGRKKRSEEETSGQHPQQPEQAMRVSSTEAPELTSRD